MGIAKNGLFVASLRAFGTEKGLQTLGFGKFHTQESYRSVMSMGKDNVTGGDLECAATVATPVLAKSTAERPTKAMGAYFKKYLTIFVGAIIAAIGLEIFLIPNNVIDGGVVGLSIMASALTDLPLGVFLVVLNLPFLYLGHFDSHLLFVTLVGVF